MATGWVWDGAWYYLNPTGTLATGWITDGYSWYYMGMDGAMQTGWIWDGYNWYYMSDSGAMYTGWLQDGGAWYYLNSSGAMVTGTQVIDGVTYIFGENGKWIEKDRGEWSEAYKDFVLNKRVYDGYYTLNSKREPIFIESNMLHERGAYDNIPQYRLSFNSLSGKTELYILRHIDNSSHSVLGFSYRDDGIIVNNSMSITSEWSSPVIADMIWDGLYKTSWSYNQIVTYGWDAFLTAMGC